MRYLMLFAVTVINLILTGTVFVNINIAGVSPDVLICTISAIALLEKRMTGAVIGLVCGLVLDLMFSGAIGLYAIPYFAIGAFAYFASIHLQYIDNYLVPCCFAAIAYLCKDVISALLTYMLGTRIAFWHMMIRYTLPGMLLTGVFMLLAYVIFRRIYRTGSVRPKKMDDINRLATRKMP